MKKLYGLIFSLALSLFLVSQVFSQIVVQPVELYRFKIPPSDWGYILSTDYGINILNGNIYQGVVGSIYRVPQGYIPANQSLRAIHVWHVQQGSRHYNYYSESYSNAGPGYTYQGIIGYMYTAYGSNPITVPLVGGGTQTYYLDKIRYCYSQSKGYWHGRMTFASPNPITYTLESPPDGSYDCSPPHGMSGASFITNRGTRPDAQIVVPENEPWIRSPEKDSIGSPDGEIFYIPDPPPPGEECLKVQPNSLIPPEPC